MSQTTTWFGYHGTSVLNATSITRDGFFCSEREDDWLGSGAYFFIDGGEEIKPPLEKSCEWAVQRARSAKPRYSNYAVLEAEIETNVHLDFDDLTHMAALGKIKDVYLDIMRANGKRPVGNRKIDKCAFCNYVMFEHGVDALIRREYIKTTEDELTYGFDADVPNCRIMCLKDPKATIRNIVYAVDRRRVQ